MKKRLFVATLSLSLLFSSSFVSASEHMGNGDIQSANSKISESEYMYDENIQSENAGMISPLTQNKDVTELQIPDLPEKKSEATVGDIINTDNDLTKIDRGNIESNDIEDEEDEEEDEGDDSDDYDDNEDYDDEEDYNDPIFDTVNITDNIAITYNADMPYIGKKITLEDLDMTVERGREVYEITKASVTHSKHTGIGKIKIKKSDSDDDEIEAAIKGVKLTFRIHPYSPEPSEIKITEKNGHISSIKVNNKKVRKSMYLVNDNKISFFKDYKGEVLIPDIYKEHKQDETSDDDEDDDE